MFEDRELYSLEILNTQYKLIENLHRIRLEKKMSQSDVSKITGLSQQAISRIETFQYSPSLPTLIKYMSALDININDLF